MRFDMIVAENTVAEETRAGFDAALAVLDGAKHAWARTSEHERIAILNAVKDQLMDAAGDWAAEAARRKLIPEGCAAEGEEWFAGPYALMAACNALIGTLSQLEGKAFLHAVPVRETVQGRLAIRVLPHSLWDRFLLSGVRAEVWMREGVTRDNLADHAAIAYDAPASERKGKVALVLGAGNVASIAPLDCFQKLFLENQVVLLKMNPVNDYLAKHLKKVLAPLIARDALRIVCGGGPEGAYLAEHPLVEEIHITGAASTHDAIVWGTGAEGAANRALGTPRNRRRITSELGGVCPTIVVPGPWSPADLAYQAENIATQKLNNAGCNCVACQVLILPEGWHAADQLLSSIKSVLTAHARAPYYPGTKERLARFAKHSDRVEIIRGGGGKDAVITAYSDSPGGYSGTHEVFGPGLSIHTLAAPDAEAYLRSAIAFANDELSGTLGANIIIHPRTIRKIGRRRFERIIADLRYGGIAINTWTGLIFLTPQCPWGAFPGHTLRDVQSGIGTVHNSLMLERTERTVIEAPWRPFPRGLLSGQMSWLPKPPWLAGSANQASMGRLLTRFQHRPGWRQLPHIFREALRHPFA
ncbi:aldehyde dehydrogenase family protein [Roseobacteraceae bacterium NS-SX3]